MRYDCSVWEVFFMAEKITALYARFSRDDGQETENASVSNQKELLQEYAYNNGYTNCRFYADDGYTVTNFDRPDFQRMLEDIENGYIDTVVVKDMSRFGRNYILVGQYVEMIFPMYGVKLIGVTDGFSSDKNNDFFAFTNIINDFYAQDISKKCRAQKQQKGNSGKRLTTRAIYGYKVDENDHDKWVIDEYAAGVVRKIFDLYVNDGMSLNKICKYLYERKILKPIVYHEHKYTPNYDGDDEKYIWNAAYISIILRKQEYLGHTVNFRTTSASNKCRKVIHNPIEKQKIFYNTHEAIVSEKIFLKAQEIAKSRWFNKTSDRSFQPYFAGKCYCSDCKKKMRFKFVTTQDKSGYVCATWAYRRKCSLHSMSENRLRNRVSKQIIAFIEKLQSDRSEIENLLLPPDLAEVSAEIEKYKKELNNISTYLRALFESHIKKEIDDNAFIELSASYSKEQKEKQDLLNSLNEKYHKLISEKEEIVSAIDILCQTVPENIDFDFYDKWIDKIYLGKYESRMVVNDERQSVTIYLKSIGNITDILGIEYVSYTDRVNAVIEDLIMSGNYHLSDVADKFGIPAKRLQIALYNENTSLQRLVTEKKKEMLLREIKAGKTINEIYPLLQFSRNNSLYSFCQRFFNMSFNKLRLKYGVENDE
jgi:DNA invertase Pin-like site-specific DNA recombinase